MGCFGFRQKFSQKCGPPFAVNPFYRAAVRDGHFRAKPTKLVPRSWCATLIREHDL
jgi:hypothetical protein